jgi:hypothetical protein
MTATELMPSLRYQVAVVHQGRHYFAHLYDLRCEGIGLTAEEAVTHVSEWRLITATHNLLKLHKHQTATARA